MSKKRKSPVSTPLPAAQMRADMTDPQGSYTGRPAEPGEKPVQDADDL